ncbi:MAG: AI-2E family transporter [Planctomycetes bacterium]|nr:AI-2E family transporter [Planctomycetota bacterium]
MTSNQGSRRFLLLLLAIAAGLLALVVAPLAGALFAAMVFAVVMQPLQVWLTARLGDRPRIAAGMLTAGLALIALLPAAWLGAIVVRQVANGVEHVVEVVEARGMDGLLADLPAPLRPFAERLEQALPEGLLPARLRSEAANDAVPGSSPQATGSLLQAAATLLRAMLRGLGGLAIELGVLAAALYFMLSEGRALLAWAVRTAPLPDEQARQFAGEFRDVTVAVFLSTMLTALLQSAIAAVGFLIAGTPHLPVWLFVTFAAAFVPAIGGAVVVASLGIFQLLAGEVGWGVFLIVWGVLPVGMIDNIAKPMIARQRLRLPGSVLFFAMLGGLATFGVMGVIAGPLIVSFFLVVVRALDAHAQSETGA